MYIVRQPQNFNAVWMEAFNSGKVANLLDLYEEDALLADQGKVARGKLEIEKLLTELLAIPGSMKGGNNFCLQHDRIALLRADWQLVAPDGLVIASGSTAEIIRQQPDGRWLYVIDHAAGASLPSLLENAG
ncbi:hypothetical protein CXZ10_13245 [Pleomorphomonas diazotrophica]|uniref:DUF4440 domain-containing protein n=1 Tax=Pleomorphomonas diazotrophica TaxID=1166257 RepID=A0A1I4V306_9HYPH|nr:hypothetical protein [Pleomorphomonas diazotrophica]PKR88711.1 hypothetical protein CXZ10_13245 [Pleomorphomonas diazotrophica]SFM95503.1 Ketosteroid isomerase homolog [Pleomorphomonas diazotrophica]